jgi:hypothetical protein
MTTLYLDYSALQSNDGPCAMAYAALHPAGRPVKVIYAGEGMPTLEAACGRDLKPPVLITENHIITSLPDILAWARANIARAADRFSGS